jgi:hypothetical protein
MHLARDPNAILAANMFLGLPMSSPTGRHKFRARLTGRDQFPNPVHSRARGTAIFHLDENGTELRHWLAVANIEDVFMACVQLGSSDASGPVVAWLYPAAPLPQPIPGRYSGVLAEGLITAGDLVGPLAGKTIPDLVREVGAGNAYVNVHTARCFPGELRGQIRDGEF